MFRTLSLLALCASAVAIANDASCAAAEAASLLQIEKPNNRNEEVLLHVDATTAVNATAAIGVNVTAVEAVNATVDWHFPSLDLDDLLSSFDPEKLKDRFNHILDDHDLSLEDLSSKLGDFTMKFQDRVNQTVAQTQDRLKAMKDQVKTKGEVVKSRLLLETTDKVTKLGDAALNLAQKVAGKVGEARGRVQTLLMSLKSEHVAEAKEAFRVTLDQAAKALSTLSQSLQQAVHLRTPTSLLWVSMSDTPDLLDQTIAKTEQALSNADGALGSAQIYIAFMNKTIANTKVKAKALAEHLSQQVDDSIETGDALADQLIDQLGDINSVLAGKFSEDEVKTRLDEKSTAPRTAGGCLGFLLLLALAH